MRRQHIPLTADVAAKDPKSSALLLALSCWLWLALPVAAQSETPEANQLYKWLTERLYIGGQITVISQQLFKFHSPYAGQNSLQSQNENEVSHSYTLYVGARLMPQLEFYIDPEMIRGNGLSNTLGVAGFPNGDVIRNPSTGEDPYLARYFLRWTVATGEGEEWVERGMNRIAGTRPIRRLVVTVGKLGTTDIFDVNSYANSTRVQFMNWAHINNVAYDYAADTRGYTRGIAVEWIQPRWAIRLGSFQMPTTANGPDLSNDLIHNRGDQAELELQPDLLGDAWTPPVIRLLAYRNLAHMGNYRNALSLAEQTNTTPNITATETTGAVKYGFGLNLEQALADDGATGLFARLGWNNGETESFAFTEADRTITIGGQLSGSWWCRPPDRAGLALALNGLSSAHSDYLAAGGLGFILGDGQLNYGAESILETYYAFQPYEFIALSLDYQFILDPGYNRDRGPASVLSIRLHIERS
jgi:high affinity Mn2+ porin